MSGRAVPRGTRRALTWLGALLLVLLLLLLLRAPLLGAVGGFLVVADPPARADLLYLLNGDARSTVRARHAARLFHEGGAPRIVVARTADPPATELGLYPNETDVNVGILHRLGVPAGAVVVLHRGDGVQSTRDEVAALRDHLRAEPAARVVVVTSDYHTRRARWLLRRGLRGEPVEILMAAAPEPRFDPRAWWRSEDGLIILLQEYLKLVHNRVAG